MDLGVPGQAFHRKRAADELGGSSIRGSLPWPRAGGEKDSSPLGWATFTSASQPWRGRHSLATGISALLWPICSLWTKLPSQSLRADAGRDRMCCLCSHTAAFPSHVWDWPCSTGKGLLGCSYSVVLPGLLQTTSHLLLLQRLSISEKDTDVAAHPCLTSMVTLGTTVNVSPGSGGLRTSKPCPGSVAHRALPHGSCWALKWCLTDMMSFSFTQSRKYI